MTSYDIRCQYMSLSGKMMSQGYILFRWLSQFLENDIKTGDFFEPSDGVGDIDILCNHLWG